MTRIVEQVASLRWETILLGGSTFWTPDVVHHWVTRTEPSRVTIAGLSILMPLAVGVACREVRNRSRNRTQSVALSMLLGVYFLGPTMVMAGFTPLGGGFSQGDASICLTMCVAFAVMPPCTLIMSTYDLSLFALLLVSCLLIILHHRYEYGRRFRPPRARTDGIDQAFPDGIGSNYKETPHYLGGLPWRAGNST